MGQFNWSDGVKPQPPTTQELRDALAFARAMSDSDRRDMVIPTLSEYNYEEGVRLMATLMFLPYLALHVGNWDDLARLVENVGDMFENPDAREE